MTDERPSSDQSDSEPRLTVREWEEFSRSVRGTQRTGEPHVIYVRARFLLGLMLGLLIGAGGSIAVAVYALGQI